MYDSYYKASERYKDACEVGKKEYAALYRALLMFAEMKIKDLRIADYFACNGIESVVIWGAGDMCELLISELSREKYDIEYVVDSRVEKYKKEYNPLSILAPQNVNYDDLKQHLIIITDMYRYNDYLKEISSKGCDVNQIISVEELLAGINMKGVI